MIARKMLRAAVAAIAACTAVWPAPPRGLPHPGRPYQAHLRNRLRPPERGGPRLEPRGNGRGADAGAGGSRGRGTGAPGHRVAGPAAGGCEKAAHPRDRPARPGAGGRVPRGLQRQRLFRRQPRPGGLLGRKCRRLFGAAAGALGAALVGVPRAGAPRRPHPGLRPQSVRTVAEGAGRPGVGGRQGRAGRGVGEGPPSDLRALVQAS